MSNLGQIGPREREILTAIIETYISTGEPVGSRTLSRLNKDGLSPATIRNVMADLVDAGFLEQPHTSAGRIPTAHAYRYYVDQISGKAILSPSDQSLISDSLDGVVGIQDFLERTSHVLSLVSSGVGVAIGRTGPIHALEHVYFSRQGANKVLAVVVTKAGVVHDRMMRIENDLTQTDLDTAARYINENFSGWTLDSIKHELARRIEKERSEYDRLMKSLEQLYKSGALATGEHGKSIFVEGVANLVANEQDRERLRGLSEDPGRKTAGRRTALRLSGHAPGVGARGHRTGRSFAGDAQLCADRRSCARRRRDARIAGRNWPDPHGLPAHNHRGFPYSAAF